MKELMHKLKKNRVNESSHAPGNNNGQANNIGTGGSGVVISKNKPN
jgi:hypothetical protein